MLLAETVDVLTPAHPGCSSSMKLQCDPAAPETSKRWERLTASISNAKIICFQSNGGETTNRKLYDVHVKSACTMLHQRPFCHLHWLNSAHLLFSRASTRPSCFSLSPRPTFVFTSFLKLLFDYSYFIWGQCSVNC